MTIFACLHLSFANPNLGVAASANGALEVQTAANPMLHFPIWHSAPHQAHAPAKQPVKFTHLKKPRHSSINAAPERRMDPYTILAFRTIKTQPSLLQPLHDWNLAIPTAKNNRDDPCTSWRQPPWRSSIVIIITGAKDSRGSTVIVVVAAIVVIVARRRAGRAGRHWVLALARAVLELAAAIRLARVGALDIAGRGIACLYARAPRRQALEQEPGRVCGVRRRGGLVRVWTGRYTDRESGTVPDRESCGEGRSGVLSMCASGKVGRQSVTGCISAGLRRVGYQGHGLNSCVSQAAPVRDRAFHPPGLKTCCTTRDPRLAT